MHLAHLTSQFRTWTRAARKDHVDDDDVARQVRERHGVSHLVGEIEIGNPSQDRQTRSGLGLALEDESGYVKLTPPPGGWKPGQYKVEIHVGFAVNELSLTGTMRFTVAASNQPAASSK